MNYGAICRCSLLMNQQGLLKVWPLLLINNPNSSQTQACIAFLTICFNFNLSRGICSNEI